MLQIVATENLQTATPFCEAYVIRPCMNTQDYHIHKMQDYLSQKQKSNPRYSLRAFARDLGINAGTLGQVIKGQRPLPIKNSLSVVDKLGLKLEERSMFLESLYRSKVKLDNIKIDQEDQRLMLNESHNKIIAEWEHFAVLSLFDVTEFECHSEEVAERLGITKLRAQVVINNLYQCGLIIDDQGVFRKAQQSVRTTEDVSNESIKKGHLEALDIGKDKLDTIEVMLRDFSEMTIAMDLDKMTEAKTIIREFRQKMATLLRDGNRTDVFQLAIQFYPLTNTNYTKKSREELS